MTRSTLARRLAVLLAIVLLAAGAAEAKLAVFTDGRVLAVTDAALVGDRIALKLPGGGELQVPATRIDRIVEDELSTDLGPPPVTPQCQATWAPEALPPDLPFVAEITAAARAANLHPWLLAALVQAESAFNPRAQSRAGARGLTQLMPAAAADRGVKDVWNPRENLRGGAEHLRAYLDRFGSLTLALAAYNAGAATVTRYEGIPPYRETRKFVRRVLRVFCPEAGTTTVGPPRHAQLGSEGDSP